MKPEFSISIVSHGHQEYVAILIKDLMELRRPDFEVVLTLNLPEELLFDSANLPFHLTLIKNIIPKGFAANHNGAFAVSEGKNFVIMNPDIRLHDDPFEILLSILKNIPKCICAPTILNSESEVEDSARSFPTPTFLAKKLFRKIFNLPTVHNDSFANSEILEPDWVAGMFIVVPRAVYGQLNGLSERYHMYYEDVDFCARARIAGCRIVVSTHAKAIHNAQRDSHRKFQYLIWHVTSVLKFFTSSAYVRIRLARLFHFL